MYEGTSTRTRLDRAVQNRYVCWAMAIVTFTLEEANALVPRVSLLMQRLQDAARALQHEAEAHAAAEGRSVSDLAPRELAAARPAARALIESLDGLLGDLQGLGVEVKDLRLGLCDFPSMQGGELVYLCWQTGEPEVAFWHPTDEGFSGRRPLPGPNRAAPLQ
jgi:hypothetical protein